MNAPLRPERFEPWQYAATNHGITPAQLAAAPGGVLLVHIDETHATPVRLATPTLAATHVVAKVANNDMLGIRALDGMWSMNSSTGLVPGKTYYADAAENGHLSTDVDGPAVLHYTGGGLAERVPGSGGSGIRVFDSLGDTDNEAFTDGEVVSILTDVEGNGPPVLHSFAEGATEGTYGVNGPPGGFLNRLGSDSLFSLTLPVDAGRADFLQASQAGGSAVALPAHFRHYLLKRNDASTQVQTFDGGMPDIAADDFDWHMYRRKDEFAVEYLGKPFAGAGTPVADVMHVAGEWSSGTSGLGISNSTHTALNTGFDWTKCDYVDLTFRDNTSTNASIWSWSYRVDVAELALNRKYIILRHDTGYLWMRPRGANAANLATGQIEARVQGTTANGWRLIRAVGYGKRTISSVIADAPAASAVPATWYDLPTGFANLAAEPHHSAMVAGAGIRFTSATQVIGHGNGYANLTSGDVVYFWNDDAADATSTDMLIGNTFPANTIVRLMYVNPRGNGNRHWIRIG